MKSFQLGKKLKNRLVKNGFISKPLLKQSIKSNLFLWLILSIGSAAIFIIINLLVGSKTVFTNIDMEKVTVYVKDENMSWLQILGLLETMGFSLNRIQVMSTIDMNSILSNLIYKIAGVLLPMIYVMIVCNRLIAAQVSDGSMAYILSTPTNRKKVIRTQYLFMIGSLIAMYIIITLGAYISGTIAYFISKQSASKFGIYTIKTLLYCFCSFSAMFGLTGICFGASAFFNKSNNSIAVGGGSCILAFLCCILGLFGSDVFVSVGVGVEAMNIFNYLTIYTLIDTTSVSTLSKAMSGSVTWSADCFSWIWKSAILLVMGAVLAYVGSRRFVKKDLPL